MFELFNGAYVDYKEKLELDLDAVGLSVEEFEKTDQELGNYIRNE